jgi:hypothetical protein
MPDVKGTKLPAIYSNRMQIRINADGIVRIVFADVVDPEVGAEDRVAVALTLNDAEALGNLLIEQVAIARKPKSMQ